MAKITISLLLILLSIIHLTGAADPTIHPRSRAWAYIEAQCRATRYPKLCVKCLANYVNGTTVQSPDQLAQIALAVSLARAKYTLAYLTKVVNELQKLKAQDYPEVRDCLAQINDGVAELAQSLKELQRMGQIQGDDFLWHQSNVQSWVSTALTEATTCIDGLSGRSMGVKLRATIKAQVLNVAQATSNALALFNRFAAQHRQRATGVHHTP